MSAFAWFTHQRVPVAAMRIERPAHETKVALLYACAYIGLAAAIGWAIRVAPLPIWGASEFLQDAWYTVVFKISFLLLLPLWTWRRWGYRLRDLTLDWRPTPRRLLSLAIAFAAGNALNLGRVHWISAAADALPPAEAA